MFGQLLRAILFAFTGLTLAGCASQPRPVPEVQQVYDVRGVSVTANAGVTAKLVRGIQIRLDRSILDTARPAPLPQALMNLKVIGIATTQGYDGIRSETQINVQLVDLATGQPLQARSFLIYSFTINERDADDSAAEAIAARVRVEYGLSQPSIRKTISAAPAVSTRMNDDTMIPVTASKVQPVVVPLKTAPAVGADQDPVLNSKTRIAPDSQTLPNATAQKPVVKPAKVAVDDGAKAKVVIMPKASAPAADEPCVETMDKKC